MKRALLGSVVCGAFLLGTLQFAGADSKSRTDSRTDATPNSADIISATAGHKGKSKLSHTVKLDGAVSESDPSLQILLQINISGNRDCEREIIWPPKGRTQVIHCGVGEVPKFATIAHPNPKTLKFVFAKRAIGSPAKYGWRVITRDNGPGGADLDSLPNDKGGKPVYVIHKLR